MTRLFTYHTSKSIGIGGIETLYRSFHKIAKKLDLTHYELYHSICGNNHFDECVDVNYIKLFDLSFLPLVFRNLFRKISLSIAFIFFKAGSSDIIVLVNPSNLIFIPKYILKNTNVVLVQANKIDGVYSTFMSKSAMMFKGKYVDKFTVYTSYDKDKLVQLYPALKAKVEIIPRGCKIPTSTKERKLSKKLVTITRLIEEQKNLSSMISIIDKLPQDFTLDIYGDGSDFEKLKLKELIGSRQRVRYLGPAIDVEKVLADYSVFLMTSRYEGFGQTLIEARSQGLPVIAFESFEALKWIVKNDVSGYVIPCFDEALFVSKLKYITMNENIYKKFSSDSLKLAVNTEISIINAKWALLFYSFHC
jgi:glycosyltransferase involved in cell wall biosynthesis